MTLFRSLAVSDEPVFCFPVIPSLSLVILSEAKNLLPGVHEGRSAVPSLIRHGFDAAEEIHPKGTRSRSLPALHSLRSLRMTFGDRALDDGIGNRGAPVLC